MVASGSGRIFELPGNNLSLSWTKIAEKKNQID
jgi:hypothetical protein